MRPVPLVDQVVEMIADLGESVRPRYRYGLGVIVRGPSKIEPTSLS